MMRPKFQNFSATQILREINFEVLRSSKIAIFAISEALEFHFCKFQPTKSEKMHRIKNSEPLNGLKWLILHFKKPQN